MSTVEPRRGDRPQSDVATDDASTAESGVEQFRATVRRAPKVGVFLVLGGLLGAIVAAILTSVHGPSATESGDGSGIISDNGLWVFVLFFFAVAIGVAVGAAVALILDRASRRRAAVVTVERGVVETVANDGDAAGQEADAADSSEVAENPVRDVGGEA